ncbi:hypothetical protein J3A83DRAFT_4185996 [Scleroderma citrinum]
MDYQNALWMLKQALGLLLSASSLSLSSRYPKTRGSGKNTVRLISKFNSGGLADDRHQVRLYPWVQVIAIGRQQEERERNHNLDETVVRGQGSTVGRFVPTSNEAQTPIDNGHSY